MLNRSTRLAAGLAAAWLAVSGLAGCSQPLPGTVKIGVAQPLSGPFAAMGDDMLRGVRLAVADLNHQGVKINGSPVILEVVAADDRGDEEGGKTAARQLIDAGVSAVIGDMNASVSMAAAPLYGQAHVPQFAVSAGGGMAQQAGSTLLHLVGNDVLLGKAMGIHAAGLAAAKSYAVLDDGTASGKSLTDSAVAQIQRLTKKAPMRRSMSRTSTDFANVVAEMRSGQVDVIVTPLADFQVESLIDQLARVGMTSTRIVGGQMLKTDRLVRRNLPIEAVYAVSPLVEVRDSPQGVAFMEKFRAVFQDNPVYGAHYAYDAVFLLVSSMQRTGSLDGIKLMAELKKNNALSPVTNSLRFDRQGEQIDSAVSVYEARPGVWEPPVYGVTDCSGCMYGSRPGIWELVNRSATW